MNNVKVLISLTITGIAISAIAITLVKFLLKKSKTNEEKTFTLSYSIWATSLLVAFSILNTKSLVIFSEALDVIYKINVTNPFTEITRTAVIFIAISCAWFWISYILNNYIITLLIGKRVNSNEMDNNNWSYFLMKGISLICFNSCLLIVFGNLLRTFLPHINTPFYH